MSVREKVAREICWQFQKGNCNCGAASAGDCAAGHEWQSEANAAIRAVLEAMGEPSEGMCTEASRLDNAPGMLCSEMSDIWQAMLEQWAKEEEVEVKD